MGDNVFLTKKLRTNLFHLYILYSYAIIKKIEIYNYYIKHYKLLLFHINHIK